SFAFSNRGLVYVAALRRKAMPKMDNDSRRLITTTAPRTKKRKSDLQLAGYLVYSKNEAPWHRDLLR
ncbi:MAG: hypothetical protein ACE5H6_01720, partial [Dehalococcoidia bacterium]